MYWNGETGFYCRKLVRSNSVHPLITYKCSSIFPSVTTRVGGIFHFTNIWLDRYRCSLSAFISGVSVLQYNCQVFTAGVFVCSLENISSLTFPSSVFIPSLMTWWSLQPETELQIWHVQHHRAGAEEWKGQSPQVPIACLLAIIPLLKYLICVLSPQTTSHYPLRFDADIYKWPKSHMARGQRWNDLN